MNETKSRPAPDEESTEHDEITLDELKAIFGGQDGAGQDGGGGSGKQSGT